MSGQEDQIKRRKRAPREHIPDGEFRNITIRVGSRTYNALADAANAAGFSISDVGEKAIASVLESRSPAINQGAEKLSRQSFEIIDIATKILLTYERHGGEKWLENDKVRVAAHYAIQALIDRTLPAPANILDTPLSEIKTEYLELWNAANTGERLGAILVDPTNLSAYADQTQRAPKLKKDWEI